LIKELIDATKRYAHKLFELPQEIKDSISMINSPHFLGYSRLGAEITKGEIDYREQFDFGKPFDCQHAPGKPEYTKLWGPPQVSIPRPVSSNFI
jgi:isopenicillin N synthase-like dioxygenase